MKEDRLQKEISIKTKNDNFKQFKDKMDKACRSLVESLYGKFSFILDSILSQHTLIMLTSKFKQLMTTQYLCIKASLGRHRVSGAKAIKIRGQWKYYTLHVFCLLLRMRDSHDFVWWAICNAAADYGGGGNVLPVLFGLSVAQNTILKHLNSINKKESLT